jgi:hypothetical protein
MSNEYFFTEKEMADLLELSVNTLRKKLCIGEELPPAKKQGRKTVFPKAAYFEWFNKKPSITKARKAG